MDKEIFSGFGQDQTKSTSFNSVFKN
jgi:hypothetical protein